MHSVSQGTRNEYLSYFEISKVTYMTFEEWIQESYEFFGPEAMKVFNQYFSGNIDYDTCINKVYDAYIKYQCKKEN